jgi:invasion protein IalB
MVARSGMTHDEGMSTVRTRSTLAALATTAIACLASAASSPGVARAADYCWSTPGNPRPWTVTCVSGPRRYQSQCTMMRNQKIRAGYQTRACRWTTYRGATGWYFQYAFYRS